MESNYRSPKLLGYIAIVLIAGTMMLELVSATIGIGQILSPDWVFEDDEGGQFSVWLVGQSLVLLVWFFVFVTGGIFFLIWVYRSHKNLQPLKAKFMQFSPGWAVGWWFIPFANLVKPFQAMREIWYESDPVIDDEPSFLSASRQSAPTYMGVWWGAYILWTIANNITGRLFDPDDLGSIEQSAYLFITTGIMSAVAGSLAIYMIWDISRRQDARYEKILNSSALDESNDLRRLQS